METDGIRRTLATYTRAYFHAAAFAAARRVSRHYSPSRLRLRVMPLTLRFATLPTSLRYIRVRRQLMRRA